MKEESRPRHFLSRRAQEELKRYANNPLRDPTHWHEIMAWIALDCPYALHSPNTLQTRVFLHCPVLTSGILYNRCYLKSGEQPAWSKII